MRKECTQPKSQSLCCKSLSRWGKHGDVVDLFGGSGSTLIACEKTTATAA
jgi:hypothetical protein